MSEELKLRLIEENFTYDKLKKSNYIKTLKTNYDYIKGTTPYELEKEDVVKRFRNIISYQAIPKCIFDENDEDILNSLDIFENSHRISEKISAMDNVLSYTLSVGKYDIDFKNGVYRKIKVGKVEVFVVDCEYDKLGFKKLIKTINKSDDIVDNFL